MDEAFFFLHGLFLSLFVLGILHLGRDNAAIAFGTLVLFFANFFFQKRWLFLSLPVTTGSHYVTALMLLLFFLCEHSGKQRATYILGVIFFFTCILLFTIKLHLLYLPAPCDSMQWALGETFSSLFLLSAPSLAAFFPLQLVGLNLWCAMRQRGIPMTLSALLLTSALQLADTTLFISIADSPSLQLVSGVYLSKLFILSLFIPLITYFERSTNAILTANE